jgi:hypothetical protein
MLDKLQVAHCKKCKHAFIGFKDLRVPFREYSKEGTESFVTIRVYKSGCLCGEYYDELGKESYKHKELQWKKA